MLTITVMTLVLSQILRRGKHVLKSVQWGPIVTPGHGSRTIHHSHLKRNVISKAATGRVAVEWPNMLYPERRLAYVRFFFIIFLFVTVNLVNRSFQGPCKKKYDVTPKIVFWPRPLPPCHTSSSLGSIPFPPCYSPKSDKHWWWKLTKNILYFCPSGDKIRSGKFW